MIDWYATNCRQVDKLLKPFENTGIETLQTSDRSDNLYYDLKGCRVSPSALSKGVYIHNHKIIIQ